MFTIPPLYQCGIISLAIYRSLTKIYFAKSKLILFADEITILVASNKEMLQNQMHEWLSIVIR